MKLFARVETEQTLRGFGVPAGMSRPLAVLLPISELAVAAALLPSATARWGAIAAVALLAIFTAATLYNLALGRRVDCRCFGQIGVTRIGPSTVIRNLVLLLLAGIVVATASVSSDALALAWIGAHPWWVVGVTAVGAFGVQTFLILQIIAQQGRILLHLESLGAAAAPMHAVPGQSPNGAVHAGGLPVGDLAPDFTLPTLSGERRSLHELVAGGRRAALFFVHPSCGPCTALIPEIARWQADFAARFEAVVLSEGSVDENRRWIEPHTLRNVLLQREHEIGDAYRAYGTPAAVLVEPDGRIGSPPAMGAEAIRQLMSSIAGVELVDTRQQALRGQPAPAFALADAGGRRVELENFKGRDLVLLFWNPNCGFCRQTAGDLVEWERRVDADSDARLVLVSVGDDKELKALGFRSPIAIDEGARVSTMFGAAGTPMALHVDPAGNVASNLAPGRDAVVDLLAHVLGEARGDRSLQR